MGCAVFTLACGVFGQPSFSAKGTAAMSAPILVQEHSAQGGSGPLSGVFAGHWPDPGIYTLPATAMAPQQAPLTAQRQVIVAPEPFGW